MYKHQTIASHRTHFLHHLNHYSPFSLIHHRLCNSHIGCSSNCLWLRDSHPSFELQHILSLIRRRLWMLNPLILKIIHLRTETFMPRPYQTTTLFYPPLPRPLPHNLMLQTLPNHNFLLTPFTSRPVCPSQDHMPSYFRPHTRPKPYSPSPVHDIKLMIFFHPRLSSPYI